MALREIKKQKTRKVISDMATTLFLERGYQNVTMAEIAQRAEVSPATLFNYFSSKESLVFDEDNEREKALVDQVMNREKGQTVLQALLEAGLANYESLKAEKENFSRFMQFIESTPELLSYSQQMSLRHEKALAAVIRKESHKKLSELESQALARIILQFFQMAFAQPDPKAALRSLFKILEEGWNAS